MTTAVATAPRADTGRHPGQGPHQLPGRPVRLDLAGDHHLADLLHRRSPASRTRATTSPPTRSSLPIPPNADRLPAGRRGRDRPLLPQLGDRHRRHRRPGRAVRLPRLLRDRARRQPVPPVQPGAVPVRPGHSAAGDHHPDLPDHHPDPHVRHPGGADPALDRVRDPAHRADLEHLPPRRAKELFESMRMDGCTEWQMAWRLALPAHPAGDRHRRASTPDSTCGTGSCSR